MDFCVGISLLTVKSAGKLMGRVFWDGKKIIFIDYFEKGRTINGISYASLLVQLGKEIKEKRLYLAKKKVFFHQDNAGMHSYAVAMAKLHELKFKLLPQPPCSPHLVPSDVFRLPNRKK